MVKALHEIIGVTAFRIYQRATNKWSREVFEIIISEFLPPQPPIQILKRLGAVDQEVFDDSLQGGYRCPPCRDETESLLWLSRVVIGLLLLFFRKHLNHNK